MRNERQKRRRELLRKALDSKDPGIIAEYCIGRSATHACLQMALYGRYDSHSEKDAKRIIHQWTRLKRIAGLTD